MSANPDSPSSVSLNPVSYVVLGFAARESPVTSYDLKQMVARSVGHFWPFPHSQLYAEPSRLAAAGLLDERVEPHGRRRRLYSITPKGRAALRAWMREPAAGGTEVRDLGLLKLFFAASGSPASIRALADEQAEIHRQMKTRYDETHARICDTSSEWEVATLTLGQRFEQMSIDFWTEVGERAAALADDRLADQGRAAPISPRR